MEDPDSRYCSVRVAGTYETGSPHKCHKGTELHFCIRHSLFIIGYSDPLCLGRDDKAHKVFQEEKAFLSFALRLLWARERNRTHERFTPTSERRVYKGHDTKCATMVAFVTRSHCGSIEIELTFAKQ